MAIGAKYLIIKKITFLNGDFSVPSLVTSAKNFDLPNFQLTKRTISIPPRGNRMLDDKKSIASNKVLPAMTKGELSIRLSEANTPNTKVRPLAMIVAHCRLMCNSSEM